MNPDGKTVPMAVPANPVTGGEHALSGVYIRTSERTHCGRIYEVERVSHGSTSAEDSPTGVSTSRELTNRAMAGEASVAYLDQPRFKQSGKNDSKHYRRRRARLKAIQKASKKRNR